MLLKFKRTFYYSPDGINVLRQLKGTHDIRDEHLIDRALKSGCAERVEEEKQDSEQVKNKMDAVKPKNKRRKKKA